MEAAYARNVPLPDFIQSAPAPFPGHELYLDAFQELSTCRPFIGMDGIAGPIPWTAIDKFAEGLGLDEEAALYFRWMIRGLDDEFLTYTRTKVKNADPGAIRKKDQPDRHGRGGGG